MKHVKDLIQRMIQRWPHEKKLDEINNKFKKALTMPEKWKLIKQAYELNMPEILKSNGRENPMFLSWGIVQSPIEKIAWHVLRETQFTFYPQLPVLNYFIDFADPIRKIGVELDGKDWHDPVKDAERDKQLLSVGWRILRVTGSEAYRDDTPPDYLDFDCLEDYEKAFCVWQTTTLRGKVSVMEESYFHDERRGLVA